MINVAYFIIIKYLILRKRESNTRQTLYYRMVVESYGIIRMRLKGLLTNSADIKMGLASIKLCKGCCWVDAHEHGLSHNALS